MDNRRKTFLRKLKPNSVQNRVWFFIQIKLVYI